MNKSKKLSKKKLGLIFLSSFIIVFCLVYFSVSYFFTPSASPLEKEFEWFRENGYTTSIQNYIDYLADLPPNYIVNEMKLSNSDFRAKVEYFEQNKLTYKVRWCKELNVLYVAQPSEEKDIMDIYYWEP